MSTQQQFHKHLVDGKEQFFNADTCPICNPQQQGQQRQRAPVEVYVKGDTCVVKVSKAQMMTIHWWSQGNAFLVSHKRMSRGADGNRILDRDGKPLWEQQTFRLNVPQMKSFINSLNEILAMAEGAKGVPQRA